MITQEYAPSVPVSDLVEHPDNPRRGDTSVIADSIAHNGFYGAVIAQRATSRVLAGNHRLRAAVSEGLETLPVIWVDVDNEAASRILLADNRTSDLAGFDNSDLAELLEQLTGSDAHLAGTGYTQADLDMLLEDLAGDDPPDNLGDTDEIPDPPPPKTVPGDIWLLGPHRVMCGDSTSPTDVDKLMAGSAAKLVWTDPPYGIGYAAMRGGDAIANDAAPAEAPAEALDVTTQALANASGAEAYFVCCDWRSLGTMADAMDATGISPKACIVWDKRVRVQNLDRFAKQHEMILYSGPYGGQPTADVDVWECARDFDPDHPTPKPVELVRRAIGPTTAKGDVVLDLFGGSGSTLIAAHQLGRHARLMELDPRYVDVICRRYQRFTGDLPVSAATGRPHDFDSD